MPRPSRWNNCIFSLSSRFRICLLTADCEVFNSVAASVTLLSRAVASKATSGLIEGGRREELMTKLITFMSDKAMDFLLILDQVFQDPTKRSVSNRWFFHPKQEVSNERDCQAVVHASHDLHGIRMDDADAGGHDLFP